MSSPLQAPVHRLVIALILGAGFLLSADRAQAQDVAFQVLTIKATGAPTGAGPEIDEELADLPAIAGLCRMYARCVLAGKTDGQSAWGAEVAFLKGAARIAVQAAAPNAAGKMAVSVKVGPAKKPCMENTSLVAAGKPLIRFCERLLDDGTYIHVVTARPL